ncbi:MAG: YlbF family regulator [Planctomycetota bacterium]
MPDTHEILAQARTLGRLIADHDAAKKMAAAVEKLKEDTDAQRALNDLDRHSQAIAEKEATGQPIEVEDKRKADELQKAVIRNATLRDLQIAQMDYADLMRQVDDALSTAAPPAN